MLHRLKKNPDIFLCALILLALIARVIPGPRTIDDAFITFRYARNILFGYGFAYNPEEAVLGTTTPLYTLLLTGLGALTGGAQAPFPLLALYVNASSDALTCLLLYRMGRRLGFAWTGLGAALVWAVAPFSVTFSIGGLETSFFICLLTGLAAAHLYERPRLAALLAALAVLTRPDALLLVAPLAVDRGLQGIAAILPDARRPQGPYAQVQEYSDAGALSGRPLRTGGATRLPRSAVLALRLFKPGQPVTSRGLIQEAGLFFLPLLAWSGYALACFGSPLPHSITAKTLAYRLPATDALVRLLQHYATPFMDQLSLGAAGIAIGLVLYPALSLFGARAVLKTKPRLWPWVVYPGLYFAAFALAHPLIFRWYLTPPLPPYIFLILVGAHQLVSTLVRPRKEPFRGQPAWQSFSRGAILLLPVILTLRGWTLAPDHGLARPAPQMAWYRLELLYRQASAVVSDRIQSSGQALPVLAAGDVGVLGYFTPARILDTVGLNSSQSTAYYPLDPGLYTINYAIPPALILDEKPDYLVFLEVYGREGLLRNLQFRQEYSLVEKIPTDIYGSDGMLIYAREPAHASR